MTCIYCSPAPNKSILVDNVKDPHCLRCGRPILPTENIHEERPKMVSFCCHADTERHWPKDRWGYRYSEDVCLKCWKPCELISTIALTKEERQ